jgi:hypothetical protein
MFNSKMKNFIAFEKSVMEKIFLFSENEYKDKIWRQYKNSVVKSRKFFVKGFYTDFSVTDNSLYLSNDVNIELGDIHAEINGLKYGAGFIVFVRNGVISLLEGYSYGDDVWPKKIEKYKFMLIKDDGSLSELPIDKA